MTRVFIFLHCILLSLPFRNLTQKGEGQKDWRVCTCVAISSPFLTACHLPSENFLCHPNYLGSVSQACLLLRTLEELFFLFFLIRHLNLNKDWESLDLRLWNPYFLKSFPRGNDKEEPLCPDGSLIWVPWYSTLIIIIFFTSQILFKWSLSCCGSSISKKKKKCLPKNQKAKNACYQVSPFFVVSYLSFSSDFLTPPWAPVWDVFPMTSNQALRLAPSSFSTMSDIAIHTSSFRNGLHLLPDETTLNLSKTFPFF